MSHDHGSSHNIIAVLWSLSRGQAYKLHLSATFLWFMKISHFVRLDNFLEFQNIFEQKCGYNSKCFFDIKPPNFSFVFN
jgi:hypothetical protein